MELIEPTYNISIDFFYCDNDDIIGFVLVNVKDEGGETIDRII